MNNTSETCYACTEVATTLEHVPPLCLFPEAKDLPTGCNLRRNLLTVPSCATHNSQKSGDDVFLWNILSLNLGSNGVAIQQAASKLGRATRRRPALFHAITAGAVPVAFHARTGQRIDTDELPLDGDRFESAIDLVARGLHRKHFGVSWLGNLKTIPDFVIAKSSPEDDAALVAFAKIATQVFAAIPMLGDNPSVFTYQVVDVPEKLRAIRMNFYGGSRVVAVYGSPDRIGFG